MRVIDAAMIGRDESQPILLSEPRSLTKCRDDHSQTTGKQCKAKPTA
jgi:hypothetical protein